MARAKLEFLTKEEMARVHEISIKVLEQVGVIVHSRSVSDLLLQNGGVRAKDEKRILVPEPLVREALMSTPKSLLLAARDKNQDINIPTTDNIRISNGGEGVYIKDLLTGDRRQPGTDDVRDFAVIGNALPQVDFLWSMVGALDQPADLKGLVELKVDFEFSTKHAQVGAASAQEARNLARLSFILAGGEKEFARRPIMSSVQCPISPLTFEGRTVEAQVELSRAMVPVVAMSAAVAGFTAPVTLAGTLAQVNAENLASMVISQLAKKGSPWIYSSDSAQGDLKTGSIDYGALETQLLRTGSAQMGRSYGLPTMTGGVGIENTTLMLGSAMEGVPHMIVMSLVPSDLGSGLGGLDQAAGASYEQLVAEAWVWDLAKEFARDFAADDTAISFETIREAALDSNFLGKRHTLQRFRREAAAASKPGAILSGRGDVVSRGRLLKEAKAEAEKILRENRRAVVSKDESRLMDDFVSKVRKGL